MAKIELRDVFTQSEEGAWSFYDFEESGVSTIKKALLIDENLPDEGCYLFP